MIQEEKSILFKDLCARLPYGVYIEHITTGIRGKLTNIVLQHKYNNTDSIQDINAWIMFFGNEYADATYFRPMLRPMSSMTEEEQFQLDKLLGTTSYNLLKGEYSSLKELLEYSYKNHIDLFGLIPKGLALEAPEGIYK